MEKILVNVYIPAIGKDFDILIPNALQMYKVAELIKRLINDILEDDYTVNEYTTLCNRREGTILNINRLVCELNLYNGSQLMLI